MEITGNKSRVVKMFGSERVAVTDLPESPAETQAPAVLETPVTFTDASMAGNARYAEAAAQRAARAETPDSTGVEAVVAGFKAGSTYRLLQRGSRPAFDGDERINQTEYLQHVPLALTDDEREYFTEVGIGQQSSAYAIEQIQQVRKNRQIVGDSPVLGFLGALGDPLEAAIPFVRVAKLGRAGTAVANAAAIGAIGAAGEGPLSDTEIALNMALVSAVSAGVYKPGKGLVKADPDFPAEKLNGIVQDIQSTKPKMRMVSPAEYTETPVKPKAVLNAADGTWIMVEQPPVRTKVKDAVWEEVPQELQPSFVNTDAAAVVKAVDTELANTGEKLGLGRKLMWNMHKTMSDMGPVGKKVADLFYDNNSDLSIHSVESHRAAVHGDLMQLQLVAEDGIRKAMADDGYGLVKQVNPFTAREAAEHQSKIEKAVHLEMLRREQSARAGASVGPEPTPRVKAIADAYDALHKKALQEMKAAGVEGAENILERAGYHNRRWSSMHIEQAIDRMVAKGLTREAAQSQLNKLVAQSLRRANQWDKRLSEQVGSAIVDRALRKGYFEDAVFNAPAGSGTLKELRDILKEGGLPPADIERALNVLRVQSDDAGKAGFMKRRVDLDYKATIRVGDENFTITDLIDSRMTTIVDQYAKSVATQVAFARKGFKKVSDIEALREELMKGTSQANRAAAEHLFDDTLAHFKGLPAGARVNDNFRLMMQYGRLISLPWSGLWQLTEFATAAAEYGYMKTLKYAVKELPGFGSLLKSASTDKQTARTLKNVLSNHSDQNLRIRPFTQRFEDGYEMDTGSAAMLSTKQAGQLVPYANGMRFVHKAQANIVANLVIDRFEQAAKGNAKALTALEKHGLSRHSMDKLKSEINKHGYNVDAWADDVWAEVRPAFAKMMDESVLHARLGDVPAFAMFDPVGKFLFTYRTFSLTAHNKILAGNLERGGAGAVGLILLYQMPLAMLAVQAQSGVKGDGALSTQGMIQKAIGQIGGLGLFTEPFKWVTGDSSNFGSPGLIPIDRGIATGQAVLSGDAGKAGSAAMTMLPVAASIPFFRGIANQLKE